MTFNPPYNPQTWLQHLIADPQHGALYPHRMLAGAYGIRVDQEPYLNQALAQLIQGQHYIEQVGRTFITLAGLYRIADLLGTSEGQLFKQALMGWSQSNQPFGEFQSISSQPAPSTIAPTVLQPAQPFPPEVQPLALRPSSPVSVPNPSGAVHPIAQELASAMRPEIERAVQAAVVTTLPPQPRANETLEALKWQREADLQLIQTVQGGLNQSQQTMASATQSATKTTADAITQVQVAGFLAETRQGVEIWFEGLDFPALVFVGFLGLSFVGLLTWALVVLSMQVSKPSIQPRPTLQLTQPQPFRTQEMQ